METSSFGNMALESTSMTFNPRTSMASCGGLVETSLTAARTDMKVKAGSVGWKHPQTVGQPTSYESCDPPPDSHHTCVGPHVCCALLPVAVCC